MTEHRQFRGKNGIYLLKNPEPFVFGRASVLFEGVDTQGHKVCIKLFRDYPHSSQGNQAVDEFFKELQTQSSLIHPNILPILDFGETEGLETKPFLVLPFCSGNLRSLINTRDFLPLEKAIVILQQIALAIDYAHKNGIIHGDIKPENILFSQDTSHFYLADFGMSKYFVFREMISMIAPNISLSGHSAGDGSTMYLSPEQLEEHHQSPLSDIYSFTIVAYEMLTGTLPFDITLPPYQQMRAKVEGHLIHPKKVNPHLSDDAAKGLIFGLSREPNYRPKTATELCQMLIGNYQVISEKKVESKSLNHVVIEISAISFTIAGAIWAIAYAILNEMRYPTAMRESLAIFGIAFSLALILYFLKK
jgi:serine/threonine-protein kinase